MLKNIYVRVVLQKNCNLQFYRFIVSNKKCMNIYTYEVVRFSCT
jgi:hypothetical protein